MLRRSGFPEISASDPARCAPYARRMPVLRVAVLEDVPLFRQLVEDALAADEGTELCASAGTCQQARTVFPASAPDVLLLDLHLPDGLGFDVGMELRRSLPDLRVIVLSEHVRPQVLASLPAEEQPYWSYLLKTGISSRADLIAAVRASRQRPVVDSRVREQPATAAEMRMDLLSDRQREILSLVASGMSNQAIAQRLYMSPKSVEYHLTQIYQQLDVMTDSAANPRVQAAVLYATKERPSR